MPEPKKRAKKREIDQVMDLLEELSEGMKLQARIRLYECVSAAIEEELGGEDDEDEEQEELDLQHKGNGTKVKREKINTANRRRKKDAPPTDGVTVN